MTDEASFEIIGRPLPRKEDRRFLTGQGRYLDDIVIPRALQACFVRSPHAHARIRSIDAGAALAAPGVVAVVTGRELADWTTTFRLAPPIGGLQPMEMTALPIDKVRYQGDPVACVVAEDRYLAEDAAELVAVEYEPLAAVVDIAGALAADAPRVDDALPSNLVSHQQASFGHPAQRFHEAHRVVEAHFSQGRQTHAPIETRGCAAVWDEGRQHLTFHIGTQVPHGLRTQLAARLRLKESQVSVISPDIGGGFGLKIALYREELTVAALARHLRRPMRWREDRMENLVAAAHAREDIVRTRAAVAADGRILALEAEITEDFGAYSFFPANYLARVIAMILTGPYRIQDYAYDVKIVLTNKCGAAPMRAPMAITSWVMDGTIEAIARALGLDPMAVRRVNLLRPEDLPYLMATGERLEDITPRETFEAVLAAVDYTGFRREQAEDRRRGRHRGFGLCVVVESTTYGSKFYKAAGIAGSGHEAAWVRVDPSGAVSASAGVMASGQGYETALAQAVAEGLGVAVDDVALQLGNTDIAPYGMGSRGARGATAGGGTIYLAACELRDKILAIAAGLLNLNAPDELRLRGGRIQRRLAGAWQDSDITLGDIARRAYLDPLALPAGMAPGLAVHKTYDPPAMTYSNATHGCEIELDIATGVVTVLRYVVAEDCGTVLNPMLVAGQQHGAVAMGLGGALYEQVLYDAEGQNLSASFADYLLPTATELPAFEIIAMNTPNRRTPAGLKGMAEGGVMGAIGAVTNAVNDALAPFSVVADRQPLTPAYLRSLLRGRD